ncbi:MAG TPA: homoserine kinase [Bacteroidia bacterium]
MKNKIKIFAPATVANFVCGYDILGFALNNCGDEVELIRNESNELTFELVNSESPLAQLPPEKNIAYAMVKLFLQQQNIREGIHIRLHKKMPLNSGMGSSSASSVAALVAANELFGSPLTKHQLLPLSMEGERMACGMAHADNVAPALFGGIVLIRSYDPLEVVQLPVPEKLFAAVIHPHIDVPTSAARKIIRQNILLKDAVTQWGNIGGLIAGIYSGNYPLLGRSMQDVLIEPARALLIPFFYEMKKAAIEKGALGFGISGSGPSVFALCTDHNTAEQIGASTNQFLKQNNIASDYFASGINTRGANIIS